MRLDVTPVNLGGMDGLEYQIDLDKLIPEAVDEAMPILVKATKNAIRSVIRNPDRSTGDLINSVTGTKCKKVRGGGYYAAIRFEGKGRNGVRNGLKAAEMEYGHDDPYVQTKAPFADRAVHFSSAAVTAVVQNHIDKELGE